MQLTEVNNPDQTEPLIPELLSDGHSKREVSRQVSASRNTIVSYESRFSLSGKSYNELLKLSDTHLAVLWTGTVAHFSQE